MASHFFNFAMGPYPKESRIAQAKRNAVGGARKRCTKGKNCSAACIAANMVCLVDLPWVGPSLTKAAAKIQAMKGKAAPAAKTAPATSAAKPVPAAKAAPAPAAAPQPAAQPAAKPLTAKPAKKPIDKVPDVGTYKKWGIAQLESGIDNLKNSPNVKPDSPVAKKAIGNMEEALKQLKAEQAAAAKPAAPAAKAVPVVKVESVDKYKTYGLPFLEQAIAAAAGQPASRTPDGKKAVANIKQAIAELKGQPPKMAPGAQVVTPTPKPAAKTTTTLPVKAGSKALDVNKYDSGNFSSFYDDAKKLGLSKKEAEDFLFDWMKKNQKSGIESKDMPAFIKDFNKASGLFTATPKPAATSSKPGVTVLPNSGDKPTRLVRDSWGDRPRTATPANPHGLSINQETIWKKALMPFSDQWFQSYTDMSSGGLSAQYLKQQGGKADESRIARILKAAQTNKFTQGLEKIYNQVKVTDKSSQLSQDQLNKLPSSVRNLVDKFGQSKLKRMLVAVSGFTGNDYTPIRNAMRGRPPNKGDENLLSTVDLQKKIAKYKRKGELIEEFLLASKNRPAVPKFRGVPMDDNKLQQTIALVKNGGSFKDGAVNSWSTKPDTSKSFTHPKGTANNRVIFRTINKLGSSVKSVSQHNHEDEILTPASARYKVVGYSKEEIGSTYGGPNKNTVHFFDVVEY